LQREEVTGFYQWASRREASRKVPALYAKLTVRSNLCRASFIERMAKSFFAVRRPKRTATNLCRGQRIFAVRFNYRRTAKIFFLPPPLQ
jgi:hypothetical protein